MPGRGVHRGMAHPPAQRGVRGPGTPCRLHAVQWHGGAPEPGDLVHTTGGSWYLVQRVGAGRTPGRYTLGCVRLGRERPTQADDADAVVWEWQWLPRPRRPAPRSL